MSAELLSVLLDIVVLIFLGITIYYALQLSKSLNGFRTYRKEFDGIMSELNVNIEQAYEAVKAMKETGNRSADDLEYLLRESQKMGEELKVINASSNSLAGRLEKLAQTNSRVAQNMRAQSAADDFEDDIAEGEYDAQLYQNVERLERGNAEADDNAAGGGMFAIQDREFGGDDTNADTGAGGFQSQAEKDLYDALKVKGGNKKKKKSRAG